MRTEWKTFLPLVVFFLVTTPAYGILTSWREPIGVVALVLTAATVGMMTLYFYIQSKTIGPRPEDRADGEAADGVGELGFYPAKSIRPLWVALTLAVIALGPVFGFWLTIMGLGMGIWSLSGWVYEFYKGDYSH